MSGGTPSVSIGLPVYNGEAQVGRALDSLLAQTHEDLELVISDNHSTDATESICREYAARDRRVRYVRSDRNRGVAWNFNQTFRLAGGRYFKWASSNDIHEPSYVERCFRVLESDSRVALAYPRTRMIDDDGAVIRDYEDRLDLPWPDPARRFRAFLARVGLCNALFGLTRPEMLRQTRLLRDWMGADIVFLGELTLHGTFVEIPEVLFNRRQERANMERNKSLQSWQEFFEPGGSGKVPMSTWRHQFEYLMADFRSPISPRDKMRVAGTIARNCVALRRDLAMELAGAFRPRPSQRPEPRT